MIALYIILGLLIIIGLLLLLPLNLIIKCENNEFCNYFRILGIKINLDKLFSEDKEKPKEQTNISSEKKKKKSISRKISDVSTLIETFREIIKNIFIKCSQYAKIKVCYMNISLGTGDAMTTALTIPLVESATYTFTEFLSANFTVKKDYRKISITPVFDNEVFNANCKVVLSMRVYGLLSLIVGHLQVLEKSKKRKRK